MSLSGAPLRVAAIVGAFVVLGGGWFVLGPGKPSAPATTHELIRHPHGLTTTHKAPHKATTQPATKAGAKTKPAHTAPPGEETAPAAKTKPVQHVAKPTPKPKPKPKPVQLSPGLPDALAVALQKHPVVVVSMYNPNAPDDQIATAEAQAGAALAGVGFVGVDVLEQDQVGPITRLLGLVEDPAILIYQRPGTMIAKLHGFADRETVAQAVQNAAPSDTRLAVRVPPATPAAKPDTTWLKHVAAVCAVAKSKSDLATRLSTAIAGFQKISPPVSARSKFAALVQHLKLELAYLQKGDVTNAQLEDKQVTASANALHLPKACQ